MASAQRRTLFYTHVGEHMRMSYSYACACAVRCRDTLHCNFWHSSTAAAYIPFSLISRVAVSVQNVISTR